MPRTTGNTRRTGAGAMNLDTRGRRNPFVHRSAQQDIRRRFYRAGRRAAGLAGG